MTFREIRTLEEKGRHKLYMVLDCETATLSFANEIARNETEKKNIAIARPLIYDIGWTIIDSDLNLYAKRNFLVTEIFSVPAVFNTAYYKDKRPIYIEMLKNGETELKSWYEIARILQNDLSAVDYCSAFNAMFDFKKAIPFTELYINQVYGNNYQEWEKMQRKCCAKIAQGDKSKSGASEFDPNNFLFRGQKYPMICIWGVACEKLINTQKFKLNCLENKMITESGKFFKTSAEATYRYLLDNYGFIEAHTALDDAEIESYILHKALKKGKIPKGIVYFPFNTLGTTVDFLTAKNARKIKEEFFTTVIEIMDKKLQSYENFSSFASQLQSSIWYLESKREEKFRI